MGYLDQRIVFRKKTVKLKIKGGSGKPPF